MKLLALRKRIAIFIASLVSLHAEVSLAGGDQPKIEILSILDGKFLTDKPRLTWGRDPFLRPPGLRLGRGPSSVAKELKLEAIIYDKQRPSAMINGQILKIGDRLPTGGQLTEVHPNYVLIEDGGSLRELTIESVDGAAQ